MVEQSIHILYFDNHLLAALKPAGVSTQVSSDTLGFEQQCSAWLKEYTGKTGNVFLQPVHRIDTRVSGLVLFARTSKALSRLQDAMRKNAIKKRYLAYVEGRMSLSEGTLEHWLYHDEVLRKAVVSRSSAAKRALLTYTTKQVTESFSLLEIELITGRYHQIRAQLSACGHPICGDFKYGSSVPFVEGAIALHHSWLSCPHPTQDTQIEIFAPLPSYWSVEELL